MRDKILAGTTSYSAPIYVQSTAAVGGLGSLVSSTSGLVGEYRRAGSSTWTSISLTTATLGSFTSGGWVADGSLVGAYEVGIPNAALASGEPWVAVRFYGAANMAPVLLYIELDAVNYQSTSLGLSLAKTTNITGFNDIAATAVVSAGAITTSSGAVSTVTAVGTLTTYTGNTVQTGDSFARIGATGSGLSSLAPSATALSTVQWTNTRAGNLDNLDAAVSTRSTYAGGAVASVTGAVGSVTGSVGSIAGVTFPTHFSSLAIDVSGNVTFNNTSLSGSVGSVTGAVGSVTGNVGGNVAGSTASVTGAVGSVTAAVSLSLTETLGAARALDAIADTSLTVNDALHCAVAAACGKETVNVSAPSLTVKTPSTGTTLRTFTLDSGTAPTTRS